MSKKRLFDDDSEDDISLKTENEYAKRYDTWREKEEIHKLEQKYGSKALNSDGSSDSEDESDEPPDVSEEMEEQFLKTLALLKTKDPRIYDPTYNFFKEEKKESEETQSKVKTLTFEDSDDDDSDGEIFKIEKKAEIDDKNDAPAVKTINNSKINKKEKKIKEYLTGKVAHLDNDEEKDLAPLKALWSDPKINEGEAFLRDYILNKKYLEEDDAGEMDEKVRDDDELEADERTVEEQDKFERAYNFRFEEPDEEYLKRFPRTMNYIRPKDDRRARKRAEVRTRKEEEKKKKMEEIARLKALKLKEIKEKIAKIKEVTGNQDLAFQDEDIEGEFDPEEHDRRMRALFDEQYYGDADDHKPVFPELDEELEIENWDKYDVDDEDAKRDRNNDELHCEDDDFNMDADYDPKQARAGLLEEIQKTLGKKRRNRKRKSKLAELLTSEKPKFVPTVTDKTYAQYMEEYYKMDCEDVIGGDLPTRFKYREVVPNDYGLTVEEILLADDRELTQWVPLKKIMKHRPDAVERGELNSYKQRAADARIKKKLLPSLFKDLPEEPEVVVPIEEGTKKKKKKKKNKAKKAEGVEASINDDEQNDDLEQKQNTDETIEDLSEHLTKKKKKNKLKHESKEHDEVKGEVNKDNIKQVESIIPKEIKKKKKKPKSNGFAVTDITNEGPSQETSYSNVDKDLNTIYKTAEIKLGSKRKLTPEIEKDDVPCKKNKNKYKTARESFNSNKEHNDKKQFNKKHKYKYKNKNNNEKSNENPLNDLSDERLKAYGLNPKKYRGFLKYKKF